MRRTKKIAQLKRTQKMSDSMKKGKENELNQKCNSTEHNQPRVVCKPINCSEASGLLRATKKKVNVVQSCSHLHL